MRRIPKQKKEGFTDQDLLLHFKKSGEMLPLAQLYKRYTSLIYGVCLKYLKNSQDAEDAYMSVFEKLVKKVRQHNITNFKSWLHVVVKNHCLEILRKQKKILTVSYDQELMQNEPFVHPFEESSIAESEQALNKCLKQLEIQQARLDLSFRMVGETLKFVWRVLKNRLMLELLKKWLDGSTNWTAEKELRNQAHEDDFLADALEGFDALPQMDHTQNISALERRLQERIDKKKKPIVYPLRAIAAALLLLLSAGIWWNLQSSLDQAPIAETSISSKAPSKISPPAPSTNTLTDNRASTKRIINNCSI